MTLIRDQDSAYLDTKLERQEYFRVSSIFDKSLTFSDELLQFKDDLTISAVYEGGEPFQHN